MTGPHANDGGWNNRRVLVTGAGGFVGSWLINALARQGAYVVAFQRSTAPAKGRPVPSAGNIQTVSGDVADLKAVSQAILGHQIDTVYHLAASNVNTGTQISPYDVYETNLRGVYTVLEVARISARPVRVIVASSREVDDCFLPAGSRKFHPYMTSKAAAEMIARAYADTHELAVAIVRSDNLYGGGDFNWNRLVPSVIQSIAQGRAPVIRGDGSTRRDYLYVEDAVAAYLAVGLRLDDPALRGKLFRLSTGSDVSVLEMVQAILRAAGREDLAPQVLNQKSGGRVDVPYEPKFERETLGWQSQYSLAVGLQRTWEWYRDHFQAAGLPEQ